MLESFEKATEFFVEYFPSGLEVVESLKPNGEIARAYGVFTFRGWNLEVEVAHNGRVYYLVTEDSGEDDDLDLLDSIMSSVQRNHAKLVKLIEEQADDVAYYN